jgi:hypothetical protein
VSELLSDVLDIPVAAGDEDYVLRLTDSIDATRIAAFMRLDPGWIGAHAGAPAAEGER